VTDLDVIQLVLAHEGTAYVDDPTDRGGCTRHGVTRPTLALFRRVPLESVTCADIQALTRDEAEIIACELYVMRAGYSQIADWRLRYAVVDMAYHSGVKRTTLALQRIVGAQPDGIWGRETAWKVAAADPERTRLKVIGARLRHLGTLIAIDPTQAKYARGWMSRVAVVLEAA
jgi:lysozyme family protein